MSKGMRIDVHTHFQCLDFVKHLQGRSTLPKSLLDGGNYIIQCATGLTVPSLPKILDMEEKLRDMEDTKIDLAVLSQGIPFGPDVLDNQEADEWAKRINDNLAEIIDRLPVIRSKSPSQFGCGCKGLFTTDDVLLPIYVLVRRRRQR